ncbi:MAG: hypothetical protein ACYC8S_01490 [Minisyncoccota bacterium]
MKKFTEIFYNAIPILGMIGLVPIVTNDYLLAVISIAIIIVAFLVKRVRYDLVIFAVGFFTMILAEWLFISTGVETFNRNSLLGIMPIWLPIIWGYGFVSIKRLIQIIEK